MNALFLRRPMSRHRRPLFGILFVGVFALALAAAMPQPAHGAAAEEIDIRVADTSSPRATLKSFIDACNEISRRVHDEWYFDRTDPRHAELALRVLDCIDQSELPAFARQQRAGEVATCIKEILGFVYKHTNRLTIVGIDGQMRALGSLRNSLRSFQTA